jgi:hypothetical protein
METNAHKPKFDSLYPVAIPQEPELAPDVTLDESPEISAEIAPKFMSKMTEAIIATSVVGCMVAILGAADLKGSPKQGAKSITKTEAPAKTSKADVPPTPPPVAIASVAVPNASPSLGESVERVENRFASVAQSAACHTHTNQVAQYLTRGEVTLSGHDDTVAAGWFVKLSPKRPMAHLAFAGFSLNTRQTSSARCVGMSLEIAPRVFATNGATTLVWFDDEGFAYAKPRWQDPAPPVIGHVPAIAGEEAENVAVTASPSGSLVAVTSFATNRTQLGVFTVAPSNGAAPGIKALGVTHYAQKPRWPAIVADASGYTLAWHEDENRIVVSRFDLVGNEIHEAVTLAESGPARGHVLLTKTKTGAIAMWSEGDKLLARTLDDAARPGGEPLVVGRGEKPALASFGDGAIVAFLGSEGSAPNQILALKLGSNGVPASKGIRISDGATVEDAPAIASIGTKLAFLWAQRMGSTDNTKRAMLRTIDAACVP